MTKNLVEENRGEDFLQEQKNVVFIPCLFI